uniref:Reverse transcriptase domain-containing protein n=1 Tax=Vitis vinifera TaxID=29760 RepID=A5BPS5_VITVI|nr:hypothetical protein VITISV_003359 [Vitis vinifera]
MGIHLSIAFHRLNVLPTARPIRQRVRHFHPDRQKIIRDEIDKLLEAGFIREVEYQDCFPLPRIDQIVNSTAEQGMLSFLDAFSGYHQIPMAPADEEKTAFITPHEFYCYKVMPFGLKNAGATYQRLMTKIFEPLVGRTVEVYIDDIVVKSKTRGEHALHFQEVFHLLRKYDMKLNPSKCAFGVSAGKFLRFMVSQRGIEVSPDQVKAVMETPPPRSKKELQRLTGKLVALGRFIAHFTDELRPFFLAIRKVGANGWTDNCQSTFEKIKHYLMQPPILSSPFPGEKLYMYQAVSEWAISAVLFRCSSYKEQKPIYYVLKDGANDFGPSKCHLEAPPLFSSPPGGHADRPAPSQHPAQAGPDRKNASMGHRVERENSWSKLFDWDSPCLTMKQNTKPSYPNWFLPWPYLSPSSESTTPYNDSSNGQSKKFHELIMDVPTPWQGYRFPPHQRGHIIAHTRANRPFRHRSLHLQYYWGEPSRRPRMDGSHNKTHKIRVQAARFTLIEGHLYKRSFTSPYLRCLDHSEALYVLAELHEGMRQLMSRNVTNARHAPIPHAPSETLKPISSHWPFAQWGMNIVGPLPAAAAQKKFLLVATNYFRKWVEVKAYASIKDKDVTKFPITARSLIASLSGIYVRNSTSGICSPHHAYRTTPGRPTGNTPFALTYGMDAVIPTEIGIPTIRIEAGRNLDWVDEVRESASIRVADYQQRAAAHYNRKARPRSFKSGMLVLRKVFENTAERGAGKFQANWEDPYIVSKTSESRAYHLQNLDGTPLLRLWNVSNLKQYYQ